MRWSVQNCVKHVNLWFTFVRLNSDGSVNMMHREERDHNFQFSLQSIHGCNTLIFASLLCTHLRFIRRRKGQGQCGVGKCMFQNNLPHKCTSKTFSFYEPVVVLFSRKSTDAVAWTHEAQPIKLMFKFIKHKNMFCRYTTGWQPWFPWRKLLVRSVNCAMMLPLGKTDHFSLVRTK